MTAMASRNRAETEVPRILPTLWKVPRRPLNAVAVAAIAAEASTTIVECPSEKIEADPNRTPAHLHQLARRHCR